MTTVNDFFRPYGITPLSPLEESNAVREGLGIGPASMPIISCWDSPEVMRLKIALALRAQGIDPEWKIAP